jgi:hypothetical protein
MVDWTLATSRDDHLDEHNQFDHTDLASLTEGRVLGVSGGKIKQVVVDAVPTATVVSVAMTPYTMLVSDSVLIVDTTGGAITVNLPSVDDYSLRSVLIKRIDGPYAVTINRNGTDGIDLDGTTHLSRTLATIGAHWAGVAEPDRNSWYTIGQHGLVT